MIDDFLGHYRRLDRGRHSSKKTVDATAMNRYEQYIGDAVSPVLHSKGFP